MNYRQVAELICRLVGLWLLLDSGLNAGASLVYLWDNLADPVFRFELLWLIPPVMGVCCGVAILVFARGFAASLVPPGMESNWSAGILCLSSLGFTMAFHSAGYPIYFISARVMGSLLGDPSYTNDAVPLPYVILYSLAEAIGLIMWLVPPRLTLRNRGRNAMHRHGEEES
jgi:hypothetical protein